jgi:hypothetical protein
VRACWRLVEPRSRHCTVANTERRWPGATRPLGSTNPATLQTRCGRGCASRSLFPGARLLAACSAPDQALCWPPPSADGGSGAAKNLGVILNAMLTGELASIATGRCASFASNLRDCRRLLRRTFLASCAFSAIIASGQAGVLARLFPGDFYFTPPALPGTWSSEPRCQAAHGGG